MVKQTFNYLTLSESTEWDTPPVIINRVKDFYGEITLDPCTCPRAQKLIQASYYWTENSLLEMVFTH